ncbi:unnamed protein product [Sphagnum balticum]
MIPPTTTRPASHRWNNDGVRGKTITQSSSSSTIYGWRVSWSIYFRRNSNTYKRAAITAPPKGTGRTAIGSEASCNNKAGRQVGLQAGRPGCSAAADTGNDETRRQKQVLMIEGA